MHCGGVASFTRKTVTTIDAKWDCGWSRVLQTVILYDIWNEVMAKKRFTWVDDNSGQVFLRSLGVCYLHNIRLNLLS